MYLALIAGLSWRSMQRPLYGLLALVLLVTGLGLCWIAITLRRLHLRLSMEEGSMDSPMTTPIPLRGLKNNPANLSKLVILLLGFFVGYMIGAEHHTSSYNNELATWKADHQAVQVQYQKDR